MDCADFRESLFGPLDLRTRLARLLHTATCAGCRTKAHETGEIGRAIRALPRHSTPDGLRERLIRTAAEQGTAPRPRRFAWSQVLVVAATLLILSAILYPVINLVRHEEASDEQDAASALTCLSNLKQLGLAFLMYAQDNDERLPAAGNWPTAIAPHLGMPEDGPLFFCPEDTDPTHWPSYAMAPGLSQTNLESVRRPVVHALLYDAEADGPFARRHIAATGARGGNAVYVDGHAAFSPAAPLGVPGHLPGP